MSGVKIVIKLGFFFFLFHVPTAAWRHERVGAPPPPSSVSECGDLVYGKRPKKPRGARGLWGSDGARHLKKARTYACLTNTSTNKTQQRKWCLLINHFCVNPLTGLTLDAKSSPLHNLEIGGCDQHQPHRQPSDGWACLAFKANEHGFTWKKAYMHISGQKKVPGECAPVCVIVKVCQTVCLL